MVAAFGSEPNVTFGGKGFGATGLKYDGKIFAMLAKGGRFVAKLPSARVDELVAAGKGDYFDPGHGRRMKEWLVAGADNPRWGFSIPSSSARYSCRTAITVSSGSPPTSSPCRARSSPFFATGWSAS